MAERANPFIKEFKDKYFGIKKNPFRRNLYERYLSCNDFIKNKTVLDIPCGMGWGTSLLTGYNKLYGVDISSEAIAQAKKLYKSDNVEFSVGNMKEVNFKDGMFDVVICLEGFEHITCREGQKFLEEVERVTNKEGILIMSVPLLKEGKYHSGNKYHLCEYREDELIDIIKENNFKIMSRRKLENPETNIQFMVLKKT